MSDVFYTGLDTETVKGRAVLICTPKLECFPRSWGDCWEFLESVRDFVTFNKRSYYTDAKGRFRDARKGRKGKFITPAAAHKRDKLYSYWATIHMITKAQGVTVAEARRAYPISGVEPWEKVAEGRTP